MSVLGCFLGASERMVLLRKVGRFGSSKEELRSIDDALKQNIYKLVFFNLYIGHSLVLLDLHYWHVGNMFCMIQKIQNSFCQVTRNILWVTVCPESQLDNQGASVDMGWYQLVKYLYWFISCFGAFGSVWGVFIFFVQN